MESVLVIAQILALLCLSALCVYLIVVLIRLRDVLSGFEKDMKELTTRAIPVLDNMEYITGRIRGITDSIDDQLASVRESLTSVRHIAENVMAFERRVQERVEGPILEGVAVIAGVFKGLRAMVERFRS
jgi:uncharacterized protein YoxC